MLPLRLTREQFDKLYPAQRGFQRFTVDQRSTLAYAKTGYRARQATGQYYYTNPLVPDRCAPTNKGAQNMGWSRYQELEEAEWAQLATA